MRYVSLKHRTQSQEHRLGLATDMFFGMNATHPFGSLSRRSPPGLRRKLQRQHDDPGNPAQALWPESGWPGQLPRITKLHSSCCTICAVRAIPPGSRNGRGLWPLALPSSTHPLKTLARSVVSVWSRSGRKMVLMFSPGVMVPLESSLSQSELDSCARVSSESVEVNDALMGRSGYLLGVDTPIADYNGKQHSTRFP